MTATDDQVTEAVAYMSPEQARGREANARSDIYSTGCLLYELLTGSPPFGRGDPIAIAWRHVNELPVPPSGNPMTGKRILPAVDAIVLKALAKSPGGRYRTAAEMRADIQRALSEQPVAALTEFPPPSPEPRPSNNSSEPPGREDADIQSQTDSQTDRRREWQKLWMRQHDS
jgi:serine/threonine protein kinase